jgi:hypothetical protein
MAGHEVLTVEQFGAAQPQSFLSRPLVSLQNWLSNRSSIQFPFSLSDPPYEQSFSESHNPCITATDDFHRKYVDRQSL